MWYMHDAGWAWWLLMTVGMVAFWGLVIYGVIRLARGVSASAEARAEPSSPTESPRLVLKQRLAAGEISVEEYEALRGVIDDAPSATSQATPG